MRRRDLAKQLVSAKSDAERRQLLTSHKKSADISLAREIKDICYASWTTEPVIARNAAAALRALHRTNRDLEIEAIASWIAGIAEVTKGKFEQAIENLDTAADKFFRVDKLNDAAQTQVAKLIALAHLGRYREADKVGRHALKSFEKTRDQLTAGKIELNLSNIAARRERHRDAETFALSALRRFKTLGEKRWQTMAENDLANTYSEINDFKRAEKYFAMAAKSARSAKMRVTEAEIESSMGNLALFRARYGDALRLLETSRQKYHELQMPHQTAIAELEMAEIYTELNLLDEAFAILESVVDRLTKLGLRAEEARARMMKARILFQHQEFSLAKSELGRASKLYTREKNMVGVGRIELLTAEVEIRAKNYGKAAEAAKRATDLLKSSGNRRLLITAQLLKAKADGGRGRRALAQSLLSKTVDEALKNQHPQLAGNALSSLGKMLLAAGDKHAAAVAFKRAIELIEHQRGPIASDELRMSFLAGNLDLYSELFKIALDEDRLEDAFAINEASRARSLSDVMERGVGGRSHGKIVSKLSELREELNWFYSRASRDNEAADIENEIASREQQIAKLTRQIESTEKGPAGKRKFDPGDLRKRLGIDTALVEYFDVDGAFGAFVITADDLVYVDRLGTDTEIRKLLEGLQFQFGTFRFGSAAIRGFALQLKTNTDRYLNELHRLLFKQLEPLVADKRVVIAPTGVLNYVPFNALFDGKIYLTEERELSLIPSAAVWSALSRKRPTPKGNILLIGRSDESIPLAEDEVRKLKQIFGGSAVLYTGKRATFNSFRENASNANIIHLACHGTFRTDNPMFSSLHLADGWITVRDLSSQRLNARLVTLSACETGLNEIYAGEELLGLTRGFIAAGAQNLIVSLWTVNDKATASLMIALYKNLQLERSPAASLRAAQKEFIERGMHPYYWSPFISIGA